MSVLKVYTLPPDAVFLDALAAGIWRRAEQEVFTLAQNFVLLPTRRACRELRQSFLDCTGQAALLLPRTQPLGDIDEEEFYFTSSVQEPETAAPNDDIPPAIAPLRRQLLLTQLVRHKDTAMPIDQAAQLAEALARFLDQVQTEGLDLANLPELVKNRELARHWQETIAFLEILTEAWPPVLAAEGCIDPADRRNRILRAQADNWRRQPPAYPVIAAGSTGSIPATRELLTVIAGLPHGAVILPGLDQELDNTAWDAIAESHPQYGLKKLLGAMQLDRADVQLWQ